MPKKNAISRAYEKAKAMIAERTSLERVGVEIKAVDHGWVVRGVTYPLLKEALKAARRLQ